LRGRPSQRPGAVQRKSATDPGARSTADPSSSPNSSDGFILTTARASTRTSVVSASTSRRYGRFRFIRRDGSEVWLEKTSRAEFDTTGRRIRLQGLTRDITRHKHAEKRQDPLSSGLDHRVKNVLARVAAVVRDTRRRCAPTDEFVKAIEGRIQS